MKKIHIIQTDYLYDIYNVDVFAKLLTKATAKIRILHKKLKFDAIAFTGTSGAALAYPISAKLKLPLICVRKGKSHSRYPVEGCMNAKKYIIIDDFIAYGNTIRKIKSAVKKYCTESVLVGIVLYDSRNTDRVWAGTPIIAIK